MNFFKKMLNRLFPDEKIKVGDYVNWISQDTNQWSEPRKVVHIGQAKDPKTKKIQKWVHVDGSLSGFKLEEIKKT